ncbi:MAG: 50S ribosomal protein L11 methyltransferase [Chitinispirillaceae bacterium]|nr:50S ribosomal protein L11 methyltransferase [Chitinispirillaceae bacterium]
MKNPTYSLQLTCNQTENEIILSLFDQSGFLGCEENDISEKIHLTVHFRTDSEAQATAEHITTMFPDIAITIARIEPQDWNAKWRESMKPARIARGWYASPLWLPPPKTARHWITIEPKMAFGTGHHESTRLAAQGIIALRKWLQGKQVLDIGSGSGILCFVADRCNAAYALGCDTDPCCRENMAENLKNNRPDGRIDFFIGSIDAVAAIPWFDLAVMNMILTESAPLVGGVTRLLKPGARLIWSGILVKEHGACLELAGSNSLGLISEKEEGEWWCGVFGKLPIAD